MDNYKKVEQQRNCQKSKEKKKENNNEGRGEEQKKQPRCTGKVEHKGRILNVAIKYRVDIKTQKVKTTKVKTIYLALPKQQVKFQMYEDERTGMRKRGGSRGSASASGRG